MYYIECDIGCYIVYDITTSMSKFFLGCRRKNYDICILYGGGSKKTLCGNFNIEVLTFHIEEKSLISLYNIGGHSKKTLFGNFDIEVLTFDIEEKASISLYDIGGRSKKTVLGNFDIEVSTFDIEEKASISLYDI